MSDSQEIIGGRYRLLEHIGRGGMGTVWRARDEVLGRHVAVKEVIPSPDLTGPEREVFTLRTLREARAAGRIGHPGVATVYDVVEEHGRPWIVMQLVDSRTLGAVIRQEGPLPPARVARIGLEVLGALLAAHQAGVLHRDVKPDNVLLARDGRAVLTDFGIAMLEGDSSVTRTGALIGTPAFIAPERANGGPARFASDLWSLGVTLYMAVEGRSPFERAHPLATLSAVMHEEPPPLRRAGALGPVIFGLLRKDPAERMSAHDLQIHLASLVNGTSPEPTMPIDLSAPVPAPGAGAVPGPGVSSAAAPMPATGDVAPGPSYGPASASPPMPAPASPPVPAPAASSGAASLSSSGPAPEPASSAGSGTGEAPRRRRRRPALSALVAGVLALVLTSGGAAWVAVNGSEQPPAGPPAPVSVPAESGTPENRPEQARLPTRKDSAPARPEGTGEGSASPALPVPDRSGQESPAPTQRPSGEPSDRPSDGGPRDDSRGDKGGGRSGNDDSRNDDSGGSGGSGEESEQDSGRDDSGSTGEDTDTGQGSGDGSDEGTGQEDELSGERVEPAGSVGGPVTNGQGRGKSKGKGHGKTKGKKGKGKAK
ncbi:serine/threonine protein kinase [Streptosporangium becharense]|uniref:non-specific serine/threonine protein kinase n=1 Tax=Streptosporangium becharense TaxID=1816182 RepID=A0A7W9ICQ4_9ACTN|nr:serine/threonine protein kinase [Streptosporangium becharense]MBB2912876.1 serine/threonine protein kinase [Streptosporangium becharense]MBB5818299.1 serine/threonine protein kinase [Streptosporangium becharense]